METYAGKGAVVEVDSHLDASPLSSPVWGTCFECDRLVQLAVERISPPLGTPALASAAQGVTGALRRIRSRRAFLSGLLGPVVGGVAHAATPVVQKFICGYCGCDDVRPYLE